MSRVEQFENIRKEHNNEGKGIRALARDHHVHRRKVRQALDSAVPPERKVPERHSPALGPYVEVVRSWLVADRQAPRKQRHTAHRVWQRLRDEYGATVAESTVRAHVAKLHYELDNQLDKVMVAQQHEPGAGADVDYGDFVTTIAGEPVKLHMFCMRLSNSGRGFHRAFAHEAQEAFLEGHVLAFERFSGVPRLIRYDNLKTAVDKVLRGRNRTQNQTFITLRSHYLFDTFFCRPGIEGAHEKGGVEGEVGRFRRNHLVPVPDFASIDELNAYFAACDAADDNRTISGRQLTVGEAFALEQPFLAKLPPTRFDPVNHLSAKVDSKGRICVRQCFYSVPVGLASRRVDVRLGASSLEVVHQGKVVARHERQMTAGTEVLVLDHYLEVLERKPGAMPGSIVLRQARQSGAFGRVHERFWDQARLEHGDAKGTKAIIGVLLAYRRWPRVVVEQAMQLCLDAGVTDPELVLIEVRRLSEGSVPAAPVASPVEDHRELPNLGAYDALLGGGDPR